jgi:DNA-binding MarR family transcriptional regulator
MARSSSGGARPWPESCRESPPARLPRAENAVRVLVALRRAAHVLRLTRGGADPDAGVTPAQLFVLAQVARATPLSVTEIADRTSTDRSSVSGIIRRLVERGLVRRRRAAHDERRVEVTATPAGRALLRRAPHPPSVMLLDGMAALSEGELQVLADGLARLVAAVGIAGSRRPLSGGSRVARRGARGVTNDGPANAHRRKAPSRNRRAGIVRQVARPAGAPRRPADPFSDPGFCVAEHGRPPHRRDAGTAPELRTRSPPCGCGRSPADSPSGRSATSSVSRANARALPGVATPQDILAAYGVERVVDIPERELARDA